jgi:peptidyl-tRNA hydrolase
VCRPSALAAAEAAHCALPAAGVHVAIHLGVAASAAGFHVEAVAVNDATFRVPDVLGAQPRAEVISAAAGLGSLLRTTVAVPALVAALAGRWGPRVCASEDAGRFLCNFLYYSSLERAAVARGAGCASHALFVHVPSSATVPLEEQAEFVADVCAAVRAQLCGGEGAAAAATEAAGAPQGAPACAAAAAAAASKDGVVEPAPSAQQQALELGFDAEAVVAAARALGAGADAEALISWIVDSAAGGSGGGGGGGADSPPPPSAELDLSSLALGGAPASASRLKLVLAVRRDLGMGAGKVAAQCCHAALKAARAAAGGGAAARARLREWERLGEPVIVVGLGAPGSGDGEGALLALVAAAQAAGVPAATVRDAGRTQVAPGTFTVAALGPAREADVDSLTGALKLL